MKIILAGGTGFIGTPLRKKLLEEGHEVMVLVREVQESPSDAAKYMPWDGRSPQTKIEAADAIINLAGENISARPWTPAQKEKILRSRIEATKALVLTIGQMKKKPSILINASAIGYYGDVPSGEVTEQSPRGRGFLAEVCEAWEAEAKKAEALGVRVVLARLGVVLGPGGGMLGKIVPPFRFFTGGPLGSGEQWISWVHIEDLIRIFLFILGSSGFSGAVNVTAPIPVPMKDFCKALGRVLKRPSWLPVPGFLLKFFLGELSEALLSGQKALPVRLRQAGYVFQYPDPGSALKNIFS